MRENYRVVR
jgi:hypothetical protein